jgi:hypothetical protein
MQATRVRLSAYYTAKRKNRNRDELLRTPSMRSSQNSTSRRWVNRVCAPAS